MIKVIGVLFSFVLGSKSFRDAQYPKYFHADQNQQCLFPVVKMREDSYEKLSKINLPGDVYSIPAGDLSDKMQSVGVEWKRWEYLPDANLTLFERTLELKGYKNIFCICYSWCAY